MYCKHCSKQINDGDRFCRGCGKKVAHLKTRVFRAIKFLKKTLLNRYVAIIAVIIFIVWIYSGDSNYGGTKLPLPTPVQNNQPVAAKTGVLTDIFCGQSSDYATNPETRAMCDKKSVQSVQNPTSAPTSVYQQFLHDRQAGLTEPYSLANGTILKARNPDYFNGDGQLRIDNGTNYDAVAKLIHKGFWDGMNEGTGGTSILTVYIKAGNSYTITNVSDGTYWLAFMQGTDWDTTNKKFVRNISYQSFDDTFNFTTTEDDQYVHYSKFRVTLNPVVGGTAETSPVNPAQFDAY